MRLFRRGGLLAITVAATAAVSLSASATAGPGMGWGQWTSPDLTFGECMTRTPRALRAEGLSAEQYGRIWFGSSAGAVSATVICYGLPKGSIVTIFAANQGNSGPSGALAGRLADRIFIGEKVVGIQSRTAKQPTPPAKPTAPDGWPTASAQHLRGQNGKRFQFRCAANGPVGTRLYGTDVYTDDSSPCTAAVHVGLLTYAKGGTVTIEIRPGQNSYPGSARNGVFSSTWGSWPGSFVVVGP